MPLGSSHQRRAVRSNRARRFGDLTRPCGMVWSIDVRLGVGSAVEDETRSDQSRKGVCGADHTSAIGGTVRGVPSAYHQLSGRVGILGNTGELDRRSIRQGNAVRGRCQSQWLARRPSALDAKGRAGARAQRAEQANELFSSDLSPHFVSAVSFDCVTHSVAVRFTVDEGGKSKYLPPRHKDKPRKADASKQGF